MKIAGSLQAQNVAEQKLGARKRSSVVSSYIFSLCLPSFQFSILLFPIVCEQERKLDP